MAKNILTDLDMGSITKVINLPDPTADGDAANKIYVDSEIENIVLSADYNAVIRSITLNGLDPDPAFVAINMAAGQTVNPFVIKDSAAAVMFEIDEFGSVGIGQAPQNFGRGIVLKMKAGQTDPPFELFNSGGSTVAEMNAVGGLWLDSNGAANNNSVALGIRMVAAQTSDPIEIKTSTGTMIFDVSEKGAIGVGKSASTDPSIDLQMVASQTTDPVRIRSSTGSILFDIDETGTIVKSGNRTVVTLLITDPNGDALTTGDGKMYFRVPSTLNAKLLVDVSAHVTTVSSSGDITVQIHNVTDAVDILSTLLTIDAGEKDSATAAVAAVINTANDDMATADELRIDVDVAGTGAKGLSVELQFST